MSKSKRRKRNDTATMVMSLVPSVQVPLSQCAVQFDGGTSNNVPSRGGFGIGYGSYRLNGVIVKLDFAKPMSANEVEVRTLIAAAEAVKLTQDPARTKLCVYGDSQVALKWAAKAVQKASLPTQP